MSNRVKNIKKNINETKYLFNNLVNTVYGSYIASVLVLNQKTFTEEDFCERMKKGHFPYMDDKDFLRKTIEAYGDIDYDTEVDGLPLCVVESDFNTLILPYIEENGEKYPMPISRDGILPQTLLKARNINFDIWSK